MYNYTKSVVVRVFVDRSAWTIVGIEESRQTAGPGLTNEEVDLAHYLADRDVRVQAIVGSDHAHLRGPWPGSTIAPGPCSGEISRCAVVFYKLDSDKLLVFVDLKSDEVVALI